MRQVWYLHELEKENERACLVELSTSLQRAVFAPREKVPAIGLNILMRGVAAKSGNILTPITTWGEDVIVTSQALRDSRTASALTFVEIAYLTRDVIYGVVSKYPMSHAIIKNAAMKIAMQRCAHAGVRLTVCGRRAVSRGAANAPCSSPRAPWLRSALPVGCVRGVSRQGCNP
jgi:hypothetical protein